MTLWINQRRRGAAIVAAMVTLLIVTLIAAALVKTMVATHRQSRRYANELQAQWLAEAALDRAVAQLRAQPEYMGETWTPSLSSNGDESAGIATIGIESAAGEQAARTIYVEAAWPADEVQRVLVQREIPVPEQLP